MKNMMAKYIEMSNYIAIQKLPTYVQQKISTASVPIKYDVAIKALASCRSIDDAKLYADKSDALAAWAKIYKDDRVKVEAKRLKLHAYRRMGILAHEIRPQKFGSAGGRGSPAGPRSLLIESGLSCHEAQAATSIKKVPMKQFRQAVQSVNPPSPRAFIASRAKTSASQKILVRGGNGLAAIRGMCRNNDPKELARGLSVSEAIHAKGIVIEIIEWMDTFDQYLPQDSD